MGKHVKARPGDMVTLEVVRLLTNAQSEWGPGLTKIVIVGHDEPNIEGKFIVRIPEGTKVLYVATIMDERSRLQVENNTKPYGFGPVLKSWHLVLWGTKLAWFSSPYVELVPITA